MIIKYPVGTVIRILHDPDQDRIELVALTSQLGIPVAKPGAVFVVTKDSPIEFANLGALVVLGLRSGWAGAREDQIEVVRERRGLAVDPKWTLTPPDDGAWEPYAYLVGEGDGWDLYWVPKDCDDPGELPYHHAIEWPFGIDDVAEREDFERIGFRVEV